MFRREAHPHLMRRRWREGRGREGRLPEPETLPSLHEPPSRGVDSLDCRGGCELSTTLSIWLLPIAPIACRLSTSQTADYSRSQSEIPRHLVDESVHLNESRGQAWRIASIAMGNNDGPLTAVGRVPVVLILVHYRVCVAQC